MKPESETATQTFRRFRGSVTTRRKLASLRVSSQRRRLRRIARSYTKAPAVFADGSAESRVGGNNTR